jgi:hypothetical protein
MRVGQNDRACDRILLAERFQSTVGARHSGIWLGWEGVQDSTYRMCLRALGVVPEISQITITEPNKH